MARCFGYERHDEERGRGRQERVVTKMGRGERRVRCEETREQSEEGMGMGDERKGRKAGHTR
jgi:hypothetical protein